MRPFLVPPLGFHLCGMEEVCSWHTNAPLTVHIFRHGPADSWRTRSINTAWCRNTTARLLAVWLQADLYHRGLKKRLLSVDQYQDSHGLDHKHEFYLDEAGWEQFNARAEKKSPHPFVLLLDDGLTFIPTYTAFMSIYYISWAFLTLFIIL